MGASQVKETREYTLVLAILRGQDVDVPRDLTKTRFGCVRFTQYQWTFLHLAVWVGNRKLVEDLIEKGISLHDLDCMGNSCLHLAGIQQWRDLYETLRGRGANETTKNKVAQYAGRFSA